MAWPQTIGEFKRFPCAEFASGSWENATDDTVSAIKQVIVSFRDEVEALTKGNPELEAIFGGLAVKIGNFAVNWNRRPANVAEGQPVAL